MITLYCGPAHVRDIIVDLIKLLLHRVQFIFVLLRQVLRILKFALQFENLSLQTNFPSFILTFEFIFEGAKSFTQLRCHSFDTINGAQITKELHN